MDKRHDSALELVAGDIVVVRWSPTGEVYTREFTERGWKSASELMASESTP